MKLFDLHSIFRKEKVTHEEMVIKIYLQKCQKTPGFDMLPLITKSSEARPIRLSGSIGKRCMLNLTMLRAGKPFTKRTAKPPASHSNSIGSARSLTYKITNDNWSPDAVVGYVRVNGLFEKHERVCTNTLYRYIDERLIDLTTMDQLLKLRRNTRKQRSRANKRVLGTSLMNIPNRSMTDLNSGTGR